MKVPTDTLCDRGRIFRHSIVPWAGALAGKFLEISALNGLGELYYFNTLLNNASLLFACAGETQLAEKLCLRQLKWLLSLSNRFGIPQTASAAIQPWVNLGRLFRLRGDYERSLEQFAHLRPTSDAAPLEFAGFRVQSDMLKFENPELLYVSDSLKVYSTSARFEDGLRFLRSARRRASRVSPLVFDEFECQFLLNLEKTKSALDVVDRPGWEIDGHSLIVNAYYRCLLLDRAKIDPTQILTGLSTFEIENLANPAQIDHRDLRLSLEISRAMLARANSAVAHALAKAGYDAARSCDDIPLLYQFSKMMGSSGVEIEDVRDFAPEHVLLTNGYVTLARQLGVGVAELSSAAKVAVRQLDAVLSDRFDG